MQASHRTFTLSPLGSMHAQNCQASLSCGLPFAQSNLANVMPLTAWIEDYENHLLPGGATSCML